MSSDLNLIGAPGWKRMRKDTKVKVDYSTYSKTIQRMNELILDKVINSRYCVRVPDFMYIKIIKVKPQRKLIDWKLSQDAGRKVHLRLLNSRGYIYKVHVYFYVGRHWALECYTFKTKRRYKQQMSEIIANNELQGL